MRRLWGGDRSGQPEKEAPVGQDPTLVQGAPATPEALLDWLEPQLDESRLVWRDTATFVKGMAQDETAYEIVEGLVEKTIRREVAPDRHEVALRDSGRLSSNIFDDMISVAVIRSRVLAGATNRDTIRVSKLGPTDPLARGIFYEFNSARLLDVARESRSLPNLMARGDQLRHHIIGGVSAFLSKEPEVASGLVAASRQRDVAPDPRLIELRKVMSVDWHLPGEDSRLRRDLDAMAADPSISEAAFLKEIAEAEQRKKELENIRRMAQFAIAASGGDIQDAQKIKHVMHQAREKWDEFPDIQSAFAAFHRERIEKLRRDISAFVDDPLKTTRSIWYPRTETDLIAALDKLGGSLYATTSQRATAEKRSVAKQGVLTVDELIKDAEVPTEPLPMGMVKNALKGERVLEPVETIDDILKQSNIPEEVKPEVRRMLEVIALDPRGQGTKVMKIGKPNQRVVIYGKDVKSRRFSPSEKTGFNTTKAARRFRVVYVVHEGTIGVVDILHHDDFDGKYSINA